MDAPWKLAGISKFQALNFLGEALYPKLHSLYPTDAGKLTGMLLDGLSLDELDRLTTDPAEFKRRADQAKEVLDMHRQKLAAAASPK